jgi:hypothetical protein
LERRALSADAAAALRGLHGSFIKTGNNVPEFTGVEMGHAADRWNSFSYTRYDTPGDEFRALAEKFCGTLGCVFVSKPKPNPFG